MADDKDSNSTLPVVALVALVAIVGLVALVMNAAAIQRYVSANKIATGTQPVHATSDVKTLCNANAECTQQEVCMSGVCTPANKAGDMKAHLLLV